MRYTLTEYGEGHTHNTYYDHKDEAVAEMERRANKPRTTYPMTYSVWSSDYTGYRQTTHAEARRPAEDGRQY